MKLCGRERSFLFYYAKHGQGSLLLLQKNVVHNSFFCPQEYKQILKKMGKFYVPAVKTNITFKISTVPCTSGKTNESKC